MTTTTDLSLEARQLGTATLYEAGGQKGALPREIKPVAPGMVVAGPAYPVLCPPGDNLFVHRAVVSAARGDVLVIDVSGAHDHGYLGDILASAVQHRGLAGVVIDGCVRDRDGLEALGLPVFARGLSIVGTTKRPDGAGTLAEPLSWAGTPIRHGDLVVGDADGAMCIERDSVAQVVAKGAHRSRDEETVLERLAAGETTIEIYQLPPGVAGSAPTTAPTTTPTTTRRAQ